MSITPAHGMPSDGQAAYNSDPYAASGAPAPYGAGSYTPAGQPTAVVSLKTPGIAVLLSFLWLGAGHLYAGRTGVGLALIAIDLVLILLLMVPLIGWVLAPLGWLGLFIYAAISSSNAVKQHNARFGVTRY